MRRPRRRGARRRGAGTFFFAPRARDEGRRRLCRRECTPHCRRRKVRLTPFPPDGENCARSLAPPLPTGTAPLGSCGGPVWRPKKRTGRARSKRKNAFAVRERFGFQESLCPRRGLRGGVGGSGYPLRCFPLALHGSVSGARRAGFPTTTNVDRRGGHAGNADSREGSRRVAWVARGFWRFGTPPAPLSACAAWERRGSVSGARRAGFTSTSNVDRRSVNAGNANSREKSGARRQETGELVAVR